DSESRAAVLTQPDRQAPHCAGHVLGRHRRAPTGDVHVPLVHFVAGDTRTYGMRLEQGVQGGDGVGIPTGRSVLKDLPEALGPTAQHGDVPLGRLGRLPAVRAVELAELLERFDLRVDKINRSPGVLV